MLRYLVLLNILNFCHSNFIFPESNSELYVTESYNLSWNNDYNNYHIYLLHKDTNSFISNTLSTYENGNLVLDDIVNGSSYLWNVPRDLNYYELGVHNFKIVVTNSEGFSSSLTNNNNDYILSEYFSIKSNMNITNPNRNILIIPGGEAIIEWNGFLSYIDISLEYLKENKWLHYVNIEKNYNSKEDYLWKIDHSVNDISEYELRIKIKEIETDIIRYSDTFFSYGLKLEKPNNQRYDYLSLENNQLNISWIENNGNFSELKLFILDENQNIIYNFDVGDDFYLWNLEIYDYNKQYYTKLQDINSGFYQMSDIFLVNYLTTTTTSNTQTSLTTTSNTITSLTDTTNTESTLSSTTNTLSTLTTTSITQTTPTSTTNTLSTLTTTSETATSLTSSSKTTLTISTNSEIYNRSEISIDKIPEITIKEKNRGGPDNSIIWILAIVICALILIMSFVLYTKNYFLSMNKISDCEVSNEEESNNLDDEDNTIQEFDKSYQRTIRHSNPLYNQEYLNNTIYQTVPQQFLENKYDKIPDRLFVNQNYQDFNPNNYGPNRLHFNNVYDFHNNV